MGKINNGLRISDWLVGHDFFYKSMGRDWWGGGR